MTTPDRPRALIGPLLVSVGVVHVGLTPFLHGDSFRSVLEAGVIGSIEADPDQSRLRGLGFWYATAGIGTIALGTVVTSVERQSRTPPAGLPWVLAGIGAWGVLLMPVSPFWVFPGLAGLTVARRRRRPATITT